MLDDTIAAISTPLGEGGIGIVRMSGKDALPIVKKLFSSSKDKDIFKAGTHTLTHGFILTLRLVRRSMKSLYR